MINDADKNKQPFGGALGAEFRRVWQAIESNQVIPANGMKVSKTTRGTVLKTSIQSGGDGGTAHPPALRSFVLGNSAINLQTIDNGSNTAEATANDGASSGIWWAIKPWIKVDGGNLLLSPILEADEARATAAWGSGADQKMTTPTMNASAYNGAGWGGVTIAKPDYIGYGEAGKWDTPVLFPTGPEVVEILALSTEPFHAMSYTDSFGDSVSLPIISYVEINTGRRWSANP